MTFEDCPTVQSLVKGRKDGYIKCLVTANPPPIITWSKDELGSESFDKNGRYIIENNGIRVRNEVSEEDAGRYDVSARVEETGEVLYQFITVDVYGNYASHFLPSPLHFQPVFPPNNHQTSELLL